jgi:hypothetical protein
MSQARKIPIVSFLCDRSSVCISHVELDAPLFHYTTELLANVAMRIHLYCRSTGTLLNLRYAYDGPAPFGAPRDGLLFLHRDALYEAGPSPLLLAWADATCSARFYDYGSVKMAEAVHRSPDKAERWRTQELDAAITFDALQRAIEQPPIEMDVIHQSILSDGATSMEDAG